MVIVEEYEEKINNKKLVELIEDWMIRRLYISKPQHMKEEILEKAKIENLKTKILLMIIILDLNLLKYDTEEAYHQEEDLNEIFYYKLNNMENPTYEDNRIENIGYDNNGDFENLDNE